MQQLFSNASSWIWLGGVPERNCYAEFCESFAAESDETLYLLISVEGQYAVFCNGQYLPSTQYPDYPFYKAVQRVELKNVRLRAQNELRIQTLYSGCDCHTARKEPPGLRFELWQGGKLLRASGDKTRARLMGGYQSGAVRCITAQLGAGFVYTAARDTPWETAVITEKTCQLAPRPIRELTLMQRRPARLVSQGVFTAHESGLQQYAALAFRERAELLRDAPEGELFLPSARGARFHSGEGDGLYLIFDLGEETTGYLDMELVCPAPARVQIGFGEHLDDLRVRTDVGGRHFTVEWQASERRRRFTHYFHRLGARYLQLFIYAHEALVYYVGILPVYYPFSGDGSFRCADHLHERIYETAKHTLRCCVHQHYEDCPWREQALYAFDSRNQMLFGYYAFGELEQPKANLRLLALSQRGDGLLELCAPARVKDNIPSFSLMFVVALEEYCRYSGDISFGEELLPVAERVLAAVRAQVRDDLLWSFPQPRYWNFYEWRPLLDGSPETQNQAAEPSAEAPLQLLYILALQRVRDIYTYLGMDTQKAEAEIQMLAQGMERFWNPDAQAYASFIRDGEKVQSAELVQALALYTGIVPASRRRALRKKLSAGGLVRASMASSIFVYEALLQEPETYAVWVFDEVAARWGKMLYRGATSFWETDDGAADFARAGSLCHAWSCVPVYLYGAYALGVRPAAPGVWEKTEPVLSGVCRARGRLCAPNGVIEVHETHGGAADGAKKAELPVASGRDGIDTHGVARV